ncbi:transmembrane protein, putative [Actinidia rufa]|uniref:Transmembrane protein, putative n=1 Tax=Actinidia rufa TaxID=165716 RepID=A0A7J0FLR8_9ERIC|nr:transmembrane protein, putative [Actinidia rufa]
MDLNSIFESSSSERRWINQISKMLEKEVRIEINDVPVSIFSCAYNSEFFQARSLYASTHRFGALPSFSPELYEMERYKIAAASRVQNQFQSLEFKQLVDKLNEIEYKVRASYHKYLDIDGETLAWIMAIDGLFLLDFLNSYVNKRDSLSSLSTTAFLVDGSGKKLANDAILGDIVMLENQMPIFLLSEILTIQSSSPDLGKNLLPPMLMGFCKAVSPLKLKEDLPLSQVFDHAHLLDLLYHLTVPKLEEHHETDNGEKGGASLGGKTSTDSGLPWKFITSLPGISNFTSKAKENIKRDRENLSGQEMKGPLVEEIMIPSVSYLFDAGVEFYPTAGDITTIKFDQKTKTFYLPVITLNVNSEVIMRNLVAYEASIASESLVLARYTELLNGIIDTDKDAKLLREKKIIINSLKSDADVAELFNGMSKSVRLTNVSFIDEAIDGVNKYFYNTKKVRTYNRMKKYVYSSWKILTLIAVVMLIVLMSLESFCSVYDCSRFYGTSS